MTTDAALREALELASLATPGPWVETCGILKHYVGSPNDEFGFSAQEMHPRDGHEANAHNDCAFVAASRTLLPAAAEAALEARAALREVRRRVVVDHYTGTSPDSPHFWSCRLCSWVWKHGEPELHEPTCPLAEPTPGSAT